MAAPTTNWIVLTGADLPKVLDLAVILKSNQNIDADSITAAAGQSTPPAYDPELQNRADELVKKAVQVFRSAIQAGDRYPISVTPGAVPPDLELHCLNMAAFQLINSTPNLQMVIIGEKGVYSPIQTMYGKALEMVKELRKGSSIVMPTDPTGQDYVNPIDPVTNPVICFAASGARYNDGQDLTLD